MPPTPTTDDECRTNKHPIKVIAVAQESQAYALTLAELKPPVKRLFVRGNTGLLGQPAVALVGSRRASAQGIEDALRFARSLAQHGLHVVSGLAVGIDSAAHRGCLQASELAKGVAAPQATGKTIAVLAHGLDQCYPARNQGLAQQILDAQGLLVSEYPIGHPPLPHQFIHRNRIIAGLSKAVCLLEAGTKSGALTTALSAAELGHDVFAVPGSIHSPLSVAAHQLIRQGAGLVTSPAELLQDLQWTVKIAEHSSVQNRAEGVNDHRALAVLQKLSPAGQTLTALAKASGLSDQEALAGLLLLEICGLACRLATDEWAQFIES